MPEAQTTLRVPGNGVLDLDHVGAPVGQDRAGGGREGELGDLDHLDALHGLVHSRNPFYVRRSFPIVFSRVVIGSWAALARAGRGGTPLPDGTLPLTAAPGHLCRLGLVTWDSCGVAHAGSAPGACASIQGEPSDRR